jgi:molecular chaperone GrpE (heat shock protein)
VKNFLSEPEIAQLVATEKGESSTLKSTILSAKAVTSETKERIIQATNHPEVLFTQLLAEYAPNAEDALAQCLSRIQLSGGIDPWRDFVSVLARGQTPNLARQLATKIREEIDRDRAGASFRLVEYASDLYRLSLNQYPEILPILRAAMKKFVSGLVGDSTQSQNALLQAAIKEEIDETIGVVAAERDKDRADSTALKSQVEKAQQETARLTQLVEMLKSSASQVKENVEVTASAEAIRPFILLLDDFERQASGEGHASFPTVLNQLRMAMDRAGVEIIGPSGECQPFDPIRHELLEEPEGPISRVKIIRPGYRFRSQTGSVIRRALVKPQRGEHE